MKCPYCSEEIQDTAKKCRFCWEWLKKDNIKNNENILIKKRKKNEIILKILFALPIWLFIFFGIIDDFVSKNYNYNLNFDLIGLIGSIMLFWGLIYFLWLLLFRSNEIPSWSDLIVDIFGKIKWKK